VQHWVQLGNSNAVTSAKDEDGQIVKAAIDGDQITAMVFPEGWGLNEMYAAVGAGGKYHFADLDEAEGHHPPVWVESSSPALEAMLAEHYGLTGGSAANRRPDGWEGDHPSVASLKAGEES
jgi:hypothetical protein